MSPSSLAPQVLLNIILQNSSVKIGISGVALYKISPDSGSRLSYRILKLYNLWVSIIHHNPIIMVVVSLEQ